MQYFFYNLNNFKYFMENLDKAKLFELLLLIIKFILSNEKKEIF